MGTGGRREAERQGVGAVEDWRASGLGGKEARRRLWAEVTWERQEDWWAWAAAAGITVRVSDRWLYSYRVALLALE